jgi:hypothetical protein
MAREDLQPNSPYFAICRLRHRLSWATDQDGTFVLTRPTRGAPTQGYYYNTGRYNDPPTFPEGRGDPLGDGSGYPEFDAYYQLLNDASARCWTAKKWVTDDPQPLAGPITMLASCFASPLNFIGMATDGGARSEEHYEGEYVFANVRYNGTYQLATDFQNSDIGRSLSGKVVDRSYLDGLCATDLTGVVQVSGGGFQRQGLYPTYVQKVSITNTSGRAIYGPVRLALAGLNSEAFVSNAGTRNTTCRNPISTSVPLDLGPLNTLANGATVSVNLFFAVNGNQQIRYTPQILGPGIL